MTGTLFVPSGGKPKIEGIEEASGGKNGPSVRIKIKPNTSSDPEKNPEDEISKGVATGYGNIVRKRKKKRRRKP